MAMSRLPRSKSSASLRPSDSVATTNAVTSRGHARKPSVPVSAMERRAVSAATASQLRKPNTLRPQRSVPKLRLSPAQPTAPLRSEELVPLVRKQAIKQDPKTGRPVLTTRTTSCASNCAPAGHPSLRSSKSLAALRQSHAKAEPPASLQPERAARKMDASLVGRRAGETTLGGARRILQPATKTQPSSHKTDNSSVFGSDCLLESTAEATAQPKTIKKVPSVGRLPPPLEGTTLRVPKPKRFPCSTSSPVGSPTPRIGRRVSPDPLPSPTAQPPRVPKDSLSLKSPATRVPPNPALCRVSIQFPDISLGQASADNHTPQSKPRRHVQLPPETPALATYLCNPSTSPLEDLCHIADKTSVDVPDSSSLELTPPRRKSVNLINLDSSPSSPARGGLPRRLSSRAPQTTRSTRLSTSTASSAAHELVQLTRERHALESRITALLAEQDRLKTICEDATRGLSASRVDVERAERARVKALWDRLVHECEEAIEDARGVTRLVSLLRDM